MRHEFLEYLGLEVAKYDGLLALSELNMSFKAPLRSRDWVKGAPSDTQTARKSSSVDEPNAGSGILDKSVSARPARACCVQL